MAKVHSVRGNKLPRVRRTDQLVAEVKSWVVRHDLKPGDRLPQEHELTEMLGCSRGTVREALKILEYQGIVEIVPGVGGGARITGVSYDHANEFLRHYFYFQPLTWESVYRTREQLEPLLAQEVVGLLTDDDLTALETTVATCEAGIAGKVSASDHRQAELEFHSILARACPDPMLSFLGGFINDLLRDFSKYKNVIDPQSSDFATAALHYHKRLLQAYRSQDATLVRTLMSEHIHDARCLVSKREGTIDPGLLLQTNHS